MERCQLDGSRPLPQGRAVADIGLPRIAVDEKEPKLAELTDSAAVFVVRVGLQTLVDPER